MRLRPAPILALFATVATVHPARGQEFPADAPIPEVMASPGSIFTSAELARARTIAVENRQRRRESYIRASEEDDIIMLDPYIVEGDRSLLMARLRRELERSARTIRSSVISRDPDVQRALALARKADDDFFRGPSPGAPEDHVTTGIDLLRSPGAVIEAWRNRDLGSLVRAPDPVTGR
jgi:hypothetical protein